MLKKSWGLGALLLIFLLLGQLGAELGTIITVVSILAWAAAIMMFVYLVVFRRVPIFQRRKAADEDSETDLEDEAA